MTADASSEIGANNRTGFVAKTGELVMILIISFLNENGLRRANAALVHDLLAVRMPSPERRG